MFGKLFNNLKSGLTKTRNALTDKINEALNLAVTIDEDLYEELEEILIMADIGMDTTMEIIERLKDKIRKEKINDVELVRPALKSVIAEMMIDDTEESHEEKSGKEVILVIGVNGVGKTTSIGKLAAMNKEKGKKVLINPETIIDNIAYKIKENFEYKNKINTSHNNEEYFDAIREFKEYLQEKFEAIYINKVLENDSEDSAIDYQHINLIIRRL